MWEALGSGMSRSAPSIPSSLELDLNQNLREGGDSPPHRENGVSSFRLRVWAAWNGDRQRKLQKLPQGVGPHGLSPRGVVMGKINTPLEEEHLLVPTKGCTGGMAGTPLTESALMGELSRPQEL